MDKIYICDRCGVAIDEAPHKVNHIKLCKGCFDDYLKFLANEPVEPRMRTDG